MGSKQKTGIFYLIELFYILIMMIVTWYVLKFIELYIFKKSFYCKTKYKWIMGSLQIVLVHDEVSRKIESI